MSYRNCNSAETGEGILLLKVYKCKGKVEAIDSVPSGGFYIFPKNTNCKNEIFLYENIEIYFIYMKYSYYSYYS